MLLTNYKTILNIMKLTINNNNPITLLILSSIAMPIAFSTWMVLLNNFSIERASFTGVEIGILQSIREIPGFLAFTIIFLLFYFKEQYFAIFSLALTGFGVAITGSEGDQVRRLTAYSGSVANKGVYGAGDAKDKILIVLASDTRTVAQLSASFSHSPLQLEFAMDDDFNSRQALAKVSNGARLNPQILNSEDIDERDTAALAIYAIDWLEEFAGTVLGLLPAKEVAMAVHDPSLDPARQAIKDQVEQLLARRAIARAAKDWDSADEIRDALAEMGVSVKDTPDLSLIHI
mgnify:CR=1 FL=1